MVQKSVVFGHSFVEVMEYLFDRCNIEDVELHAEIARRKWFRRNSVVHEEEFIHPNELIRETSQFIDDY
jgi:hypothetical protein